MCTITSKILFRQLLIGPKSTPDDEYVRQTLTLCQLALQNMYFSTGTFSFESPLGIFLGVKVHTETRSKKLIQTLKNLALDADYWKVEIFFFFNCPSNCTSSK